MRFDWYTATIRDVHAASVQDSILSLGGGLWDAMPRGDKARQYQHAVEFKNLDSERTEGWMRWGGNGGGVLVDFSGEAADPVANLCRTVYAGNHSPTRADLCVDLRGPGLFDALHAYGVELAGAAHPRIGVRHDGDWTWLEKGRTLYFGSSQSATQVVIYEKGLQLLGKGIDAPRDLVRLELRLRPGREMRRYLPAMDLPSMWGLSKFSAAMLERATFTAVERFRVPDAPIADEKRFAAFCEQWGMHVLRWGATDPAAFLLRVRDRLSEPRRRIA